MIREAIATGNTIEEAREAAVLMLGARDDENVEFEIIDLPQKKSFGFFGGSNAKVRVFIETPEDSKPVAPKSTVTEKPSVKAKPQKEIIKPRREEAKAATGNNVVTDDAEKYLLEILKHLGVSDIKTTKKQIDGGVEFDIEAEGLGIVIGRRGDTLEALQHLVSLVANKGETDYFRVTLNPGSYREKREGTLQGIARRSAIEAIKSGKNVVLEPMNSYERRIIHTTIQDMNGASSWSIGENENRRVCIGTEKKEGQKTFNRPSFENRDRMPPRNNPVKREPKKDSNNAPLYGRIDK